MNISEFMRENYRGDIDLEDLLNYLWEEILDGSGFSYWGFTREFSTEFAEIEDMEDPGREPMTIYRRDFEKNFFEYIEWIYQRKSAGKFRNQFIINFAGHCIGGLFSSADYDADVIDQLVQITLFKELRYG